MADRVVSSPLSWPDRLVEAGVLCLLVFTPLAYGTVEPWAEAIAGLVILLMAVLWLLGMVAGQWEVRVELPPGWLPAALFLLLVVVQAVALPGALAGWLAPVSAGLASAGVPVEAPDALILSLDPHTTWREGLKLLAVAAFFLVVYNTYRTRAQSRRALWTMIGVGAAIAVFGIVQRMTWNGRFYWIGPEAPHASAFGPFVNRTHFAALIVIVVPMALAMLLAGGRDRERGRHAPRSWGDRLRQWNARESGPVRLIPWLILLMGGAALVSGSRGGVVALIGGLLVMVGLGARGPAGRGRAARVALALVLIVLSAIWIGGDILYGTLERLAEEVGRPEESVRVAIWRDALALWRTSPVVGSGYATFTVGFPLVRTLQLPIAFTHAESDWVQLLTDSGALGLLLVLALAGALGLALLRRYREAQDRWARALALGGLVALVGTAVQGIGNYNLPVMSSFVSLALALALALHPGEGRDRRADEMGGRGVAGDGGRIDATGGGELNGGGNRRRPGRQ